MVRDDFINSSFGDSSHSNTVCSWRTDLRTISEGSHRFHNSKGEIYFTYLVFGTFRSTTSRISWSDGSLDLEIYFHASSIYQRQRSTPLFGAFADCQPFTITSPLYWMAVFRTRRSTNTFLLKSMLQMIFILYNFMDSRSYAVFE
jgi:hypothetical protein